MKLNEFFNMEDYRNINRNVMIDTVFQCESVPELKDAIRYSAENQFMVSHEETMCCENTAKVETEIVISGKRSFEAAKCYGGKKVAVLNFANNHSIGGAPFSAGAQEESLCRCSTLYPCLQAMKICFYDKHRRQFESGEIDYMGSDDLIYTPDVVVFKTDERTEPIYPKMMDRDDWYKVDVITCAAPELRYGKHIPADYESQIASRIKKILDVAAKKGVQVLILGAWGCGAFGNSKEVVASTFQKLVPNYSFEIVEYALATSGSLSENLFAQALGVKETARDRIISLLRGTERENIETVIKWLDENNFFNAPASVIYHNNFEGGLAKHSLEVYEVAMELNKEAGLPDNSVILCSLLHDVCKSDQYVMVDGKPVCNQGMTKKGHGRRSMFILKRGCELPLNYDEEMAIWWHMGEHEESRNRFEKEYGESAEIALCRLIQEADSIAAHAQDSTQANDLTQAPSFEYNREYTPERIASLNEGEIFVFGSNIRGHHSGGAAYDAVNLFGAEWGVGEGLTGRCYALPTMEGGIDYIAGKVQNFINCAKEHPELKFYVTPIACGIAGFTPSQIAPLFKDAISMSNVILPKQFVQVISEICLEK